MNKKQIIFIFIAIVGLIIGFYGMNHPTEQKFLLDQISVEGKRWFEYLKILNNTVALFLIEWNDNDENIYIILAKSIAIFLVFYGAMLLYLNHIKESYRINKTQKRSYTLLVGLGEQNSNFLKNLQNYHDILTIELDEKNRFVDEFRQRGFAIITGDAKEKVKNLNLKKMQTAIISTGNDRQNIEIAMELLKLLKDGDKKKLYLNIENSDLDILFKQGVINSPEGVDIVVYSLYDILIRELFLQHTILGTKTPIIDSQESFSIALVGNTAMSLKLVYHISLLSNLPNENTLYLHLVDTDAQEFLKRVKAKYTGIENIPHLKLITHNLDSESLEFYTDKLWETKNLTNIIVATDDEDHNLQIAIKLQDITYPLKDENDKEEKKNKKDTEDKNKPYKTKIHFAIYSESKVAKQIEDDKELFENFYPFANLKKVVTKENIIDEKHDLIAKLIHSSYTGENLEQKQKLKDVLDEKWLSKTDMNIHKRESSKSQASHIDIKLLALGLKRESSEKTQKELLEINQAVFDKALPKDEIKREFPESFDTPLSKLARAEHNRWNTFHFLNGWVYDKQRLDKAKRHHCLIPFSKFDTDKLRDTYKYDVDATVNIPLYLSYAGYEIVLQKV